MEKYAQQAEAISKQALDRIAILKLLPTPENYDVWYNFYAGTNTQLQQAIKTLESQNTPVTEDVCRRLHTEFLSEQRNEEMLQKASAQIRETFEGLDEVIQSIKGNRKTMEASVGSAQKQISGSAGAAEVNNIFRKVLSDFASMIKNDQQIETALESSSKALEFLYKDLDEVRREARTDGLTGVANRKSFDTELPRLIAEARANGANLSLVMIDIDYFKKFNDTYGHQIGDQVLKLVARTLKDSVKGRDVVARYGGEEFAIIFPETPVGAAVMVADNLRQAVAGKEVMHKTTGEVLGRITMSAGVACLDATDTPETIIERADQALYKAKQIGRNRVVSAN
ncbi:MAG: diguanylate cyclase [Alphaproteobacteria bacterium]|nr:diguanylate cyclase [Alphaproteobacteria bacterium]